MELAAYPHRAGHKHVVMSAGESQHMSSKFAQPLNPDLAARGFDFAARGFDLRAASQPSEPAAFR
jgi:hypothetical protein